MTFKNQKLVCRLILLLGLSSATLLGQGKMAAVFEHFRRTGDPNALRKEIVEAADSGVDLQVDIPFLVNVVSYSKDSVEQTTASGIICALAYQHAQEGDAFRPAVDAFERHLSDQDENAPWKLELVMLHAILGLQPDQRTLALIYEMTGDKSDRAQGLAFAALCRVSPLPKEAKLLFQSRLQRQNGKISGAPILESMEYALPDPDVTKMIATAAEGSDVEQQRAATRILARMNPMPPSVVELFRRLQGRHDLDQTVAASVHSAIERINRLPAPPDKP